VEETAVAVAAVAEKPPELSGRVAVRGKLTMAHVVVVPVKVNGQR